MAVPLLAPFAPLLPVLVGLSTGTPLKYAQFRHSKGLFSSDQLRVIESASELVQNSIEDRDKHLSRSEAREFLKEVLSGTVGGMKNSILSVPKLLNRFKKSVFDIFSKPSSS